MNTLGLVLTQLAAAVWIGAIVFQSFIVAPLVFRRLEPDPAQTFLRAIFPRFFRLGVACGSLMLAGLAAAVMADSSAGVPSWLFAAAAAMTAAAAWGLALIPGINAARDAGSAGAARFRRLHGLSVVLTLLNLALGISVLVALTGGPPNVELSAGLH
jgi:uncharacterized membrane protein